MERKIKVINIVTINTSDCGQFCDSSCYYFYYDSRESSKKVYCRYLVVHPTELIYWADGKFLRSDWCKKREIKSKNYHNY